MPMSGGGEVLFVKYKNINKLREEDKNSQIVTSSYSDNHLCRTTAN
jgi:hypothetical protein